MTKPNVLIFMTDHQRADTVVPGGPVITPHLDRFIAQGLRFTNAYCPSPHCCPSRATFMTGLYPSRHGVWNNVNNGQALSRGLNEGVRCWSQDLQDAGYTMAWSGKWHVSTRETPKNRGFDELGPIALAGVEDERLNWQRYHTLAAQPEPQQRAAGQILRPGYGPATVYGSWDETREHHDQVTIRRATDALPELAASGKPWCLYVGVGQPHDPYMAMQKYLDQYRLKDVPLPPSYSDPMTDKPGIVRRMRRQIYGQLSPDEVRDAIRHFWAVCAYLDALFAQVLAALDATGQADDTLVLYCSDHGDYCGEHGLFSKGIPCYRGAYQIPAIVRWPRGIASPGRTVDSFVSLADFAPTFGELAGVTPDPNLTGASLLPFFQNRMPDHWREEICTQCNGVELYYTQRSVMTDRFKYVFNGSDEDELYDLQNDPHEMVNLARDPEYVPVVRDMCRRLWRFAEREQDTVINSYITVGLAPFGPADGMRA